MKLSLAVLLPLLVFVTGACGDDAGPQAQVVAGAPATNTTVTTDTSTAPASSVAVSDVSIDEFRVAVGANPSLAYTDYPPADLSFIASHSDFLATAELTAVRPGDLLNYGTDTYACQSEEGPVPEGAEEDCSEDRLGKTVAFDFAATEVQGTGDGVQPGETFTVEVFVAYASEDSVAADADRAIARMVETAPIGEAFVVYGIDAGVGANQFAHPAGWALIQDDGSLIGMDPEGESEAGLAGATNRDDLPPPERTD